MDCDAVGHGGHVVEDCAKVGAICVAGDDAALLVGEVDETGV